jgi:hypothetical protein
MSGNAWVGQHAGKEDSRITRISPYLFGKQGVRNILFLPKLRDLPASGLDFKAIVFDFGFNPGSAQLSPRGAVQKSMIAADRPVLIWGLTSFSSPAGEAETPNPYYVFQLLHSHEGNQRQLFSKYVNPQEIGGNFASEAPPGGMTVFRMPYMVLKADQLTCTVRLTGAPSGTNPVNVQVVLYGGEFD